MCVCTRASALYGTGNKSSNVDSIKVGDKRPRVQNNLAVGCDGFDLRATPDR